ncbi:MAG: F0F1 ATP synthase subunit delta [Gammaproteobacteria bacterium]|nr:F0F1 ATP synthase subunit delta [Gammaproteobacteria bacterium]
MADNASTARPYAKALYELAQETESFAGWSNALSHLAAVAADDDFSGLVNDPRVEADKIADLLIDISAEQLPPGGDNFVRLLVQNDRLEALDDIHQQFTELVAKAQALVNAEVVTAMALTEQQKSALEAALAKRLGLKVSLQETVDASLMGGAVVKAGDLVIDGSAKGRLDKLSTTLLR